MNVSDVSNLGMIDWIRMIKDILTYIVAIGGAVVAIRSWLIKPIKKQMELDKEQTAKIDQIIIKVNDLEKQVEANQAELVHDRLQTLHEKHCYELGWCSATEKSRIIEWYNDYHAKGYNHLVDTYVDDISKLPEKAVPKYKE